jgi:tRNA-(ms[2]io[6]A)-hydroxylase
MSKMNELPLRCFTPLSWVKDVSADLLSLLNDHAHLEKKAANNALELLSRWPREASQNDWASGMSAIAQDEASHLNMVLRLLRSRGGEFSRGHRNAYTSSLRDLVRAGKGQDELLDRLLISALIECRSCERFLLLSEGIHDNELAQLYSQLWLSEMGHYKVFLEFAEQVASAHAVSERWQWFLGMESEIIQMQEPGPRLHSGWTSSAMDYSGV